MANTSTLDGTGFRQDVQNLGENVGTLKADINNLAHGAVDVARSGASELRHGAKHIVGAAREKFDNAKGAVRERVDGARGAATNAAESVTGAISRNPVTSIAIALGVGFLIGAVVCRRR